MTRRGADAELRVADRGIGIPESDRPQLFQSFHRAGNVGEIPGTGLGLVLVKRCVELHGGSIEVRSRLGEGTTVSVRLPVFTAVAASRMDAGDFGPRPTAAIRPKSTGAPTKGRATKRK